MRIALVGTRGVPARYGGFETCVEEVGRRLVKAGHEVVVYCRKVSADSTVEMLDSYEGMQLVYLPAVSKKSLETLSHTAHSVRHLRKHPVDVAIVFNSANSPFVPFLRSCGIPVATHVDGLEWMRSKWQGIGSRYYRIAESLAVRWSDALIADAQGISDYYRLEFGADTELIAYGAPIVSGENTDRLARVGVQPGQFHLVVARFEPENHVDVIVDGYRQSSAQLPLVVVGSAPYADEYTARIHSLADDRVHFTGGIWDQELLDQLYANCATYLHGHSVGGTNPSLLRAIGAGAPTIAFDVNFNREVVQHTGAYFRTAADVAAQLQLAEQFPHATAARGEEGRTLAYHYDWDDVAASYEALCESLVLSGVRTRRGSRERQQRRPSGRRRGIESLNAVTLSNALVSDKAGSDESVPARSMSAGSVPDAQRRARGDGVEAVPMKVLVAHPSTELYGSDRQLVESVAGFTAAGWDVTVAMPEFGSLAARFGRATVVHAPSPVLRKAHLSARGLLRLLLSMPFVVWRLAQVIRRASPDLVYVNTVTLPHWLLAARLTRRPVLVHVHEAEEMSSPAMRRALYAPLMVAQCVVANSATTARVVAAACPRLRDRIVEVPNGIADPGAQPTSSIIPGRLALVSRLSPRKGVDVALEALALLRATGRDVSLTVCGSAFVGYEWFDAQLQARAARPDLAGSVTFRGFLDSVVQPLGEAEVVVAPSFGESFGNAAVEGMLAARPVVASDVQGLAEIIDNGIDGLLVPAGDPQALADAVASVLDDSALAASLAAQARATAISRFSIERYRRDMVDAAQRTVLPATAPSGASRAPLGILVAAASVALALLLAGCTGSSAGSASGSAPSASASDEPASNVVSGSAGAVSSVGPSTPAPTVRRTPVPAPGSGDIGQTVSAQRVVTRPAVGLSATAAAGGGISVRLSAHTTITAKATRPGEIAGPASKLTLTLTNGSSRPISLDNAVVNDTDSRGVPLVALAGPPTAPFHGRLSAGSSTTATYVFVLAQGRHNPYTISVSYSPGAAVVLFVGDAA